MPVAVQNECPRRMGCGRRENVRSIDKCQADSFAQADRSGRVLPLPLLGLKQSPHISGPGFANFYWRNSNTLWKPFCGCHSPAVSFGVFLLLNPLDFSKEPPS